MFGTKTCKKLSVFKLNEKIMERKMPLDRRKSSCINPRLYLALLCFMILFSTSYSSSTPSTIVSCPSPCTCSYKERLVNCSNRSLRKIPLIPPWVSILSLRNNKIEATAVKQHTFMNLPNLQELDLSDNELRTLSVSFSGSPLLRTLRLDTCSLIAIPTIEATGRPNITTLALSHNIITTIEGLTEWPSLRVLDLSFNTIRGIRSNTFINQGNLTELYLHKNNITTVNEHAFAGLVSLETLSLGRNRIGNGRNGLKYFAPSEVLASNAECIGNLSKLRFLDLSRNRINHIKGLAFNGMCQLRTLLLHGNRISNLKDASFYSLKALTTLRMDDNRIRSVDMGWLYDLKSLEKLSLSRNKVNSISSGAWKLCKEIRHLNLSHNDLTTIISKQFESLTVMQTLDLSRNAIVAMEKEAFYGLRKLKKLVLSRNLISSSVEDLGGIFRGLESIETLLMNNNRIRSLSPDTFVGADKLVYLDLRNNNITSVQNKTFQTMKNLKRLRINSASFLCDCQLAWFSQWLRDSNISTRSEGNCRCFHPPKLKGRRVVNIGSNEFECGEHPIPTLLQQPSKLTAYKGENVTLECSASATLTKNVSNVKSSALMSVVWRRGRSKTVIQESPKIRIRKPQRIEGGHIFFTSFLILYDVTYDSDDDYSCVISNEFGHAKSTPAAHLSVYVYPTITKQPEDRTVKSGSEVIFQCQASGHPIPDISWQKDGGSSFPAAHERRLVRTQSKDVSEPGIALTVDDGDVMDDDVIRLSDVISSDVIPRKRKKKLELTEDAPLHISEVQPKDAGVYTCTAKSVAGVQSVSATLTVLYPPIVEKMPDKIEAVKGGNAVLKCMSSANPAPQVTWLLNGGVLNGTTRHFFAAGDQLLVIVNFSSLDQGEYACSVTNLLGTRRSSSRVVLVEHLKEDTKRLGLWDEFFGGNGIVILAVFICVLATSLVWLIVLCYTKRNHEGAPSTNTESTDFQPDDSSSHGSLDKTMMSLPVNHHMHSRTDILSTSHQRHNFSSLSRSYVDPGIPRHVTKHRCDKHRTLQQHPVRAVSASHVHNMRVEHTQPQHYSSQCLSSPSCQGSARCLNKRRPNPGKRRQLRRRPEMDTDRESPFSSESEPGSVLTAVARQPVVVSSARVVETSSLKREIPEAEPLLHPPPVSSISQFTPKD
ncbi:leucine-rich repeats and immunoglobulin-like domains protein 3 [Ciona intestinalis]